VSSKSNSVLIYKIRKLLSQLSEKKGRGTELVTLYVPKSKALHEVINSLREEYGTASNIKSDTTKNHVQDALTKTMQRLKLYKKTPENGIVIFAGAIPGDGPPGSEIVEVYEILPHQPVKNYLYRCDDHFHLSHLRNMMKEKETIGILSIEASEAGIGIVSGDKFTTIRILTSGIAGKHRSGGQSARRFERLRNMELNSFYHRVADNVNKILLDEYKAKSIIVSGPGPTKNNFLKEEYLDYRLQNNLLAIVDTSYAGEEGLRETVEKANDVLSGLRLIEEKKLVQKFLREVNKEAGMAIYGFNDIKKGLLNSSVETIMITDDIGLTYLKSICNHCGKEEVEQVGRDKYIEEKQKMTVVCSKCSSSDKELQEKDIIEYLADLAIDSGVNVEVISSKTEEGRMLKSFGGIAALLRFIVRS
tara:strand:- start:60 stop:1313 length:1254 start_codon:yes stop_codon:yes gene_type:complete